MSRPALQVENLSKVYRLGVVGTGSMRQDISRWWKTQVVGKEDPFFRMENSKEYLWALRDVDFTINEGETWGIVGANGAGKSTLLKVLSRIIRPTRGAVRGNGTVSSLLEVGTGFHEELTGRENIFISGNILGMHRQEIAKKFDEIVAFSGVEKFIDTPVKRYSSGMYVRLAFAVAAHLEPDILIVDEVLAVGDADFQKKCLGKMRQVSEGEGRTIIFVSHNMQAISNLCQQGIWLEEGRVKRRGDVTSVVNTYLAGIQKHTLLQEWEVPEEAPGNDRVRIKRVELIPQLADEDSPLDVRTPLTIRFAFWNYDHHEQLNTSLHLFSYNGECIFDVFSQPIASEPGLIEGECQVPGNFLNDGAYYFSLLIQKDTAISLFYFEECLSFEVEDYRENILWYGKWMGAVRPHLPYRIKQVNTELVRS